MASKTILVYTSSNDIYIVGKKITKQRPRTDKTEFHILPLTPNQTQNNDDNSKLRQKHCLETVSNELRWAEEGPDFIRLNS